MTDLDAMDYIHCPYLGKADDRNSFYHQATRRHRCYRWEQPLLVRRQDQEQYCLSSLHVSCPRLTDASALPVPVDRARRRRRRSLRILGLPARRFLAYVIPMVLLFVAAVGAAAVLVRHMAAPPLPTTLAAAGDEATATVTATTTPFPTWTATASPTPDNASINPPPATPLPPATPTPTVAPRPSIGPPGPQGGGGTPAPVVPTSTPPPTRAAATTTFQSPVFDSPLASPTARVAQATRTAPPPGTSAAGSDAQTPAETPVPGDVPTGTDDLTPHSHFVLKGEPVKTLLPGGVDVCAKVFGRVYNEDGFNVTKNVAVAVDWWPDNRLVVGEEGWPPINPDGTYEFCLTRGQFNLSVVAPKTTSEQVWIDLDEPDFVGQIVLEVNFQAVK